MVNERPPYGLVKHIVVESSTIGNNMKGVSFERNCGATLVEVEVEVNKDHLDIKLLAKLIM